MKHTTPDAILSREMLCFVRDQTPTVEEFIFRFGGPGGQVFHVFRKCGLLVVEHGRVSLSHGHLSTDGQQFSWGCWIYRLDRDEILLARHGIGAG